MADKKEKISNKYKAVDPDQFRLTYNDSVPKYESLCKGESVSLDSGNETVKDWIRNNIIIKEQYMDMTIQGTRFKQKFFLKKTEITEENII